MPSPEIIIPWNNMHTAVIAIEHILYFITKSIISIEYVNDFFLLLLISRPIYNDKIIHRSTRLDPIMLLLLLLLLVSQCILCFWIKTLVGRIFTDSIESANESTDLFKRWWIFASVCVFFGISRRIADSLESMKTVQQVSSLCFVLYLHLCHCRSIDNLDLIDEPHELNAFFYHVNWWGI